ncbi:primase-helicase family protein [Pseudomonas kermanshahensis]|uniref:Primase-helicase family protein n=1 Tax=Pseudomonas kermanshahensis TaxID=2745482 RepID=A0ABU8R233_9PSED
MKKLLDVESAHRIDGKPSAISAESQLTLSFIHEDFVLDAVTGNPMRILSGQILSRVGFKDLCQQEYGFVVGTDADGRSIRANSGDVWLVWSDHRRRSVEVCVMEPTTLTADQDAAERPLVLNRWHALKREYMVEPHPTATRADIQVAEDFLRRLSDNDQVAVDYVLNVLAQIWQKPGIKIPTALLLLTPYGRIGKNLFFRLVRNTFGGPALCGEGPGNKLLKANFDDGVADKLFRGLNEVRLAGVHAQEAYDNLKTMITEEHGSFEGKGTKRRDGRNLAYFIMNSNHDDALPIMQDEGRICVLRSTARRAQTPEGQVTESEYYKELVEWIEGPGPALMAGAFARWQFPQNWDPYAPVPQSNASKDMQEAARGALHNNMEHLRLNRIAPFDKDILVVADITGALQTYGELWGCSINTTTVGRVLKQMPNLEFVALKIDKSGAVKGEQPPVMRVYLQPSAVDWRGATAKQRGDYLYSKTHLSAVGQPDAELIAEGCSHE